MSNFVALSQNIEGLKTNIFQRSGSVTFGSGKRNSLFSKPTGVVSPALGKSSSKSFSKPEISYDRY